MLVKIISKNWNTKDKCYQNKSKYITIINKIKIDFFFFKIQTEKKKEKIKKKKKHNSTAILSVENNGHFFQQHKA